MKTLITLIILTVACQGLFAQRPIDRLRNLSEPEKPEVKLATIPTVNGSYEYMDVIALDSTYRKSDLYRNSKLYFTDNFKSANDVIQYDDKDQAMVVGKGHFIISKSNSSLITPISLTWDVWYNTSIESKDGRYRYRIYDIKINQSNQGSIEQSITIDEARRATGKGVVKKISADLYNRMAAHFNRSEINIRSYMAKKNNSSLGDF